MGWQVTSDYWVVKASRSSTHRATQIELVVRFPFSSVYVAGGSNPGEAVWPPGDHLGVSQWPEPRESMPSCQLSCHDVSLQPPRLEGGTGSQDDLAQEFHPVSRCASLVGRVSPVFGAALGCHRMRKRPLWLIQARLFDDIPPCSNLTI